MSKLLINAVTISVSFSDKEYGKGQEFFQNISAKSPDAGVPLENLPDVIDQSLDMFFATWKAILTDRFIAGQLPAPEYKELLDRGTQRIEKVKGFLRKHDGTSTS